MNEQLSKKPSVPLIICRILAAVIVLGLVISGLCGIIDLRTQEQKDAAYKETLMERQYVSAAMEGIRAAYQNQFNITPERVVVFNAGETYVAVLAKDLTGMYVTTYYNASANKSISSYEYDKAYNSIASYQNFVGSTKEITTKFEGTDLQILCEEVLKEWR